MDQEFSQSGDAAMVEIILFPPEDDLELTDIADKILNTTTLDNHSSIFTPDGNAFINAW